MKINRQKFNTVFMYQGSNILIFLAVCAAVLIINLVIGLVISSSADDAVGGSNDIVTIIMMLLLGVSAHNDSFKYSLYNGTSRRTYFYSLLLVISGSAVVLGLMTTIFMQIAVSTGCSLVLYAMLYSQGYGAMLLWIVTFCLYLGVFGWFLKVLYDVLSRIGRYILILGITVFALLMTLLESLTAVSPLKGLAFCLGLLGSIPNPFIASLFFVFLYVIFGFATWLIVRRTEIK